MRIALLADLHANRQAVEAVLEHAERQGVDRWAFLGDFVGYGADPAWVVDTVRHLVKDQGAWAVQGNHDAGVVRGPAPTMRPDARAAVEWTRSQLDASQIDFLTQLPMFQEAGELLFVHANAYAPSDWDYVTGRAEAVRSMHASSARITFCGHMHEPRLFHLNVLGKGGEFNPEPGEAIPLLASRRWLVIPGSAGQPRDGNPAACYALYDDAISELTFWRVPYDTETASARVLAAGLPPALAQRLLNGH